MANPKITVLIDTYNHERFIEEAIVSVLEQDFPQSETEVIVVDDGSTDRTPEIIRKFEPRVRLIHKPNGGQASAFNAGIPEAKGEIVAFLDGDDWWTRNKLTRVAKAMAADPSVGIVGHGIIIVHRDGRQQTEILREECRFQANSIEGVLLFRRRGSFLGTSRMTIRRELLDRIGMVPEALVVEADEYLFTLASALATARILPETLTYYRLHEANGFQMSSSDPDKIHRKQRVLATLVQVLNPELRARGIGDDASRAITERIQADADQLRLMADGGWPWETVNAEWKTYEIAHPDAPLSHRAFKILSLFPGLVLPPKTYYRLRQLLVRNELYQRARKRWLPIPQMSHIRRDWRTGP